MNGFKFWLVGMMMVTSYGACDWRNCESGTYSMSASYLYWQPCMDGLFTAIERKKVAPIALAYQTSSQVDAMAGTNTVTLFNIATNYRTDSAVITDSVKTPTDCWDSGFRLGIAYTPYCAGCDFKLNWTWFLPTTTRTTVSCPDTFLIPYIGLELKEPLAGSKTVYTMDDALGGLAASDIFPAWSGCSTLQAESVKSRWQLTLSVIDFEVGQELSFSPCLKLRPHIDLRFQHIEQNVKVNSTGVLTSTLFDSESTPTLPVDFVTGNYTTIQPTASTAVGITTGQKIKQTFRGIGPRVGFDADLALGCQWGFYGDAAVSLVYGSRSNRHRETASRTAPTDLPILTRIGDLPNGSVQRTAYRNLINSDNFNLHRKNNGRCSAFSTDVALGLYWDGNNCSWDNEFDYEFRIGWEHHYFFNQGLKITSTTDDHYFDTEHDFSTQGLTVKATLGF